MQRDLLSIISEMRQAPPKSSDDPRFDELEGLAEEMGGAEDMEESMLGGESMDPMAEGEEPMDGEEGMSETGLPSDQEDEALMAEALGADDMGEEPLPEEGMEEGLEARPIKAKGNPLTASAPSKKKRNPLMKKSSYLA